MLDREELPPLARLGPSFALFGAAAGFFSVLAFGAVNFGSRLVHPAVAACAAALAGGLFGVLLRRSDSLRSPFIARENLLIRLGVGLASVGGLAGLFTGAVTIVLAPSGDRRGTLVSSTLAGAFVGAALLPACAAVYGAALRAVRAREGSVVSRADRARVRRVLFATLSLLALGGLPAIALDATSYALGPALQLALTLAVPLACVVVVAVSAARASRSLGELGTLALRREACAPAEPRDATSQGMADLGLGDERWSEIRVGHAYRAAREASVVLRGNVDEARAALREARTSALRALGLATSAAVVVASLGAASWHWAGPRPVLHDDPDTRPPASLAHQRPVWVSFAPARDPDGSASSRDDAPVAFGTGRRAPPPPRASFGGFLRSR